MKQHIVEGGILQLQIGVAIGIAGFIVLIFAIIRCPKAPLAWRIIIRVALIFLPFLPYVIVLAFPETDSEGVIYAGNVVGILGGFYTGPAILLSGYLFDRTTRKQRRHK